MPSPATNAPAPDLYTLANTLHGTCACGPAHTCAGCAFLTGLEVA